MEPSQGNCLAHSNPFTGWKDIMLQSDVHMHAHMFKNDTSLPPSHLKLYGVEVILLLELQ